MAGKGNTEWTTGAGLSSPMTYSLADHQHRFAVWAAARATQRGLAKFSTSSVNDALTACGVVAVADNAVDWPTTARAFARAHRNWCRTMRANLRSARIGNVSHGRAAKAIAIYLKVRIVLGGHHDSAFAKVIHPPIDRILLQGVAKHLRARDPVFARRLQVTTWTSLTEVRYDDLIARLRGAGLNQPAFWWIERFWNPRREEE
jgi:hypothetical protein